MTTKKTRGPAEAVAQAAALRPKLEAAADRLNEKIAEFEKTLKGLKLGVSAAVVLWNAPDTPEGEALKFTKWGNDWHLVVVEYEDLDEKYDRLQNKSREQRLAAVERFPDLVDALIEAAEEELARVSKSTDSIDSLIKSLQTGSKS